MRWWARQYVYEIDYPEAQMMRQWAVAVLGLARRHKMLTAALLLLLAVQVAIRLPPEYSGWFIIPVAFLYPLGIWYLFFSGVRALARRRQPEGATRDAQERQR